MKSVGSADRLCVGRAALLAVLALGVIGMHSTATFTPAAAATSVTAAMDGSPAEEHPVHGGQENSHQLLGACLAVLGGGVLLVVALVPTGVLFRSAPSRSRGTALAVTMPARAPPTTVRLAVLCVLRR